MTESNITSSARIVVGVDGSRSSIDGLRYAAELAQALRTDLVAVASWRMPNPAYGDPAIVEWSPEEDAKSALDGAIREVFPDGRPAWFRTDVVEGQPARVLIEASKAATMLIVGSRGHGGFAGLLLGSVSAACAEYAECPVLVFHNGPRGAIPAGR